MHILLAGYVGYKSKSRSSDSWIERKLTVAECIAEAQKPQEMKAELFSFAKDLTDCGMGFDISGLNNGQ